MTIHAQDTNRMRSEYQDVAFIDLLGSGDRIRRTVRTNPAVQVSNLITALIGYPAPRHPRCSAHSRISAQA